MPNTEFVVIPASERQPVRRVPPEAGSDEQPEGPHDGRTRAGTRGHVTERARGHQREYVRGHAGLRRSDHRHPPVPSRSRRPVHPTSSSSWGSAGAARARSPKGISTVLGWEFAEGDAFHSDANVAKMQRGQPLTDDDRWPWLESIGDWISGKEVAGESAVVTCSALRRVYRDLLRRDRPHVRFLHVEAPERRHPRPHGAPARPLHAGLAPAQPARHPRAPRGRRARRIRDQRGHRRRGARPFPPRPRPAKGPHRMMLATLRHTLHTSDSPPPSRASPTRPPKEPYAGNAQLVLACLLGILAVVLLITVGQAAPVPGAHARFRRAGRGGDHAPHRHRRPASSPASGRPPARWACSSPSER